MNYEEALSLQPDIVFTSDEEVTANARKQGLTTVNVMFQDYEGLRNDVSRREIEGDDSMGMRAPDVTSISFTESRRDPSIPFFIREFLCFTIFR